MDTDTKIRKLEERVEKLELLLARAETTLINMSAHPVLGPMIRKFLAAR